MSNLEGSVSIVYVFFFFFGVLPGGSNPTPGIMGQDGIMV